MAVSYNATSPGYGYNNDLFSNDSHDYYPNSTEQDGLRTPNPVSCELFLFIFFALITGTFCVLGVIGNIISMIVLQKDRGGRVHAATVLLQALAIADNCVLGMSFIFLCIIFGLLPMLNAHELRSRMIPYIIKYFQPIAHMGQTSTVWMTVLLAVNRYIAICRPFDTHRLASLRKTKIQVAVVFAFALFLNFPRFFQYSIYYEYSSKYNATFPYVQPTGIGPRTLFGVVYTTGFYTAIVLLLPILLLVILNGKLILELRKMSRRHNSIPHEERRSEENITLVMIVIIIIFIVCNTPDRINEILKHFSGSSRCTVRFYFDCVSQFLVVANSSTNFVVYYIFRRRFRQVLLEKLCRSTCPKGEYAYRLNGQSNHTDRNQGLTLLTTNGMTSKLADSQTIL